MRFDSVPAILLALPMALSLSSCSTTIEAYKLGTEDQHGIPFFVPKHLLSVYEPVEVGRREELYALLELGGVHRYLYELEPQDMSTAIDKLRKLLHLGPDDKIELSAAPKSTATVATEQSFTSTETDKEGGREESDSHTWTRTNQLVKAPETIAWAGPPQYQPADIAKAYEVLSVPDPERGYELVVKPKRFASSKVTITLADGWRLESVNQESGENPAVAALQSLASTLIGARKELQLAKVSREQNLSLSRLAQAAETERQEDAAEPADLSGKGVGKTRLRLAGFVKKITITVVEPGVYDLNKLISSENSKTEVSEDSKTEAFEGFETKDYHYWQRVSF